MSTICLTGRSFRVQFRADADVLHGVCAGRVEHIRSGDAAHFSNLDELMSFVALCFQREAAEPMAARPSSLRDTVR